jgi:hypothetical protein
VALLIALQQIAKQARLRTTELSMLVLSLLEALADVVMAMSTFKEIGVMQ